MLDCNLTAHRIEGDYAARISGSGQIARTHQTEPVGKGANLGFAWQWSGRVSVWHRRSGRWHGRPGFVRLAANPSRRLGGGYIVRKYDSRRSRRAVGSKLEPDSDA